MKIRSGCDGVPIERPQVWRLTRKYRHVSVERAEQGVIAVDASSPAFVIVKGSGVPAITVMGYNHRVSWDELLSRLKRITAGNAPIIK